MARLGDAERIRAARVHPIALLAALRTYASGRGIRGHGEWVAVREIVEQLPPGVVTVGVFVNESQPESVLEILTASGVLDPCAMMQMPSTPRSGLPPYSS